MYFRMIIFQQFKKFFQRSKNFFQCSKIIFQRSKKFFQQFNIIFQRSMNFFHRFKNFFQNFNKFFQPIIYDWQSSGIFLRLNARYSALNNILAKAESEEFSKQTKEKDNDTQAQANGFKTKGSSAEAKSKVETSGFSEERRSHDEAECFICGYGEKSNVFKDEVSA